MKKFIDLNQITKSFGGTKALSQVSFSVGEGSVHAVVGENGAGKSTLMKILMGIHQPDSGEILLDGKPVSIPDPIKARELGFGIVFQEIALCANLSIMENLFLGSELASRGVMRFSEMEKLARETLERVHLKLDPKTPVSDLSVAQKQMVQIARAILYKPRLIIFDEPTSALTSDSVQSLYRIIRQLKEDKVTVLYISHKMEEIFEIADTVTVLRDGKHIATLGISEVTESRLVQMMVGRELDLSSRRSEIKTGEVLLKVENLSGEGFSNISLDVKAGEIVGVAGLVGSGRSELVGSIFGVRPISAGKIWLGGEDVTGKNVSDRARKGMALVPEDRQFAGLVFTMVVKENLALPGVVLGFKDLGGLAITSSRVTSFAQTAIQKLRIVTSGPNAEILSLSGGNQQKVVIGKWLLLKPRVFMLDEPTRGIDVGAKAEIHNLIRELANEGRAMLVVSSELPELLSLSDRILVMREGKLMGEVCGDKRCEEEIMRLAVSSTDKEA
jgi:ABC-type sugar transport system ATPase subunit